MGSALELGSGSCAIAGIAAGFLCREVTLTDRQEVIMELAANVKASKAPSSVHVKVLDWADLDFTLSFMRPGDADILLMSDVVYFPMLWKPLVHTLLAISTSQTVVYWANCDKYPHYSPDL